MDFDVRIEIDLDPEQSKAVLKFLHCVGTEDVVKYMDDFNEISAIISAFEEIRLAMIEKGVDL